MRIYLSVLVAVRQRYYYYKSQDDLTAFLGKSHASVEQYYDVSLYVIAFIV